MLKTVTNIINASQIQTPIALAGDVTLSTGNLIIGTAGKGIDFSAAGGTVLDDYEEGTYTPEFTGFTLGNASGINIKYKRVGNICVVSMYWQFGSTSTWTGEWTISLPFAADVAGGGGSAMLFDTSVGVYAVPAIIAPAHFSGIKIGDNDGAGFVTNTSPFTWVNTDRFMCSVVYQVA